MNKTEIKWWKARKKVKKQHLEDKNQRIEEFTKAYLGKSLLHIGNLGIKWFKKPHWSYQMFYEESLKFQEDPVKDVKQ